MNYRGKGASLYIGQLRPFIRIWFNQSWNDQKAKWTPWWQPHKNHHSCWHHKLKSKNMIHQNFKTKYITAFATLRFLACENPINLCIYSKSHIKVYSNDFVLKWTNSTVDQTMIDCFIKDISCQWDKQIPNKLLFQKTQQKLSNRNAWTQEERTNF